MLKYRSFLVLSPQHLLLLFLAIFSTLASWNCDTQAQVVWKFEDDAAQVKKETHYLPVTVETNYPSKDSGIAPIETISLAPDTNGQLTANRTKINVLPSFNLGEEEATGYHLERNATAQNHNIIFGITSGYSLVNFDGRDQQSKGEIIVSPLSGVVALNGMSRQLTLGRRLRNWEASFVLEDLKAAGYFSGEMIGNESASFDRLTFDSRVKLKKKSFGVKAEYRSPLSNQALLLEGFGISIAKQAINVKNENAIDWIKLNNSVDYRQSQLQVSHNLGFTIPVFNSSQVYFGSQQDIGIKSIKGSKSLSEVASVQFAYRQPFQKIKSGPDVTSLHPSQGFIEMMGGRSLGSPNGVAYLSEDDYDGNIKFHNILALNSSQDTLVRFSFGQCSASCWFGLIGREKKRVFFKTEPIKELLGPANLTSSLGGTFSVDTVGLERHFLLQKQPQLQPYTFLGLNVSKGEVSQISSTSYRDRTSLSRKTKDIAFAGLSAGFGVRRNLGPRLYAFSEHSLMYFDGNPFGTPLKIKEIKLRGGIGFNF